MNDPTLGKIWAAQVGLDELLLFLKTSWKWGEVDMGEVRVDNDQNTLYENSQAINKNIKGSNFL